MTEQITEQTTETEVVESPVEDKKIIAEGGIHEGELFRRYIKEKYMTVEEMAQKLGVTRQAVFLQTRRPYLSTRFRKKLSAVGGYPFKNHHTPTLKTESPGNGADNERLLQEIKRLQQIVALQAEHIKEIGKMLAE